VGPLSTDTVSSLPWERRWPLRRRGARPRGWIAPSAVVWLVLGAAYFLIPLVATFLFSLNKVQTGKCCTLHNYGYFLHDPQFWTTIKLSFILSVETIVVSLILFVPTVYWVHLNLPKLRPVIAFMALIPFVVPPIILVVGLLDLYKGTPGWFYGKPYGFLVAAYVILAFPYMYFALDAGFRAIDVHTLTEASQNLGASWWTTLGRVIIPNIRVAALGGSFLTLAIVMGEFTMASLSAFHTFPYYIQLVNETKAYEPAALSLLSFLITWGAMLMLLFVGRGRPRPAQVAAAR
jgi:putative spermidine/putrescine transport system permease protein